MSTREQLIERLTVNDKLVVEGQAQLGRTTIRDALTVGDSFINERPPALFYGDLTVKGVIDGSLKGIIEQINASDGIIVAERVDPRLIGDLRDRLSRMVVVSNTAIAVALLALVLAIVALAL
jgi:hypothetical protein